MTRSKQTVDITLSFAHWLRSARRSLGMRLWYKQKSLHDARIQELGESGGFYLRHDSLVENQALKAHTTTLSKRGRIQFYHEADLPMERPDHFCDHHVEYPLWGTDKVRSCSSCSGKGYRMVTVDNKQQKRTCSTCAGDGKVYTYTSLTFYWRHHCDKVSVLLENSCRPKTRNLIEETAASGLGVPLTSLDAHQLTGQIDTTNPRIVDTLELAQNTQAELEHKIEDRGLILMHERMISFVPMCYLNVSIGRRYGQYFATGHSETGAQVLPPRPMCFWRISVWVTMALWFVLYFLEGLDLIRLTATHPQFFSYYLGLPGALLVPAVIAFMDDEMVKSPPLWLLLDDGDGSGWRFSLALTTALAREGRAKVEDPYYTLLFDPKYQGLRERHSFWCTLTELESPRPRQLELLYPSFPGRELAASDVAELGGEAQRIIWVSSKQPFELDEMIAGTLPTFKTSDLPPPEVWVLGLGNRRYERADFNKTGCLVGQDQLHVYHLGGEGEDLVLPGPMFRPWPKTE